MSVGEKVEVPTKLYLAYREAYLKLQVLEAHGVDNWEGYDDAMSELFDDKEDDNDTTD